MAEEALEQLKNRLDSLERELHDVKLKVSVSTSYSFPTFSSSLHAKETLCN